MIALKILYWLLCAFCVLTFISFMADKTTYWDGQNNKELLKDAMKGSIKFLAIIALFAALILTFASLYTLIF